MSSKAGTSQAGNQLTQASKDATTSHLPQAAASSSPTAGAAAAAGREGSNTLNAACPVEEAAVTQLCALDPATQQPQRRPNPFGSIYQQLAIHAELQAAEADDLQHRQDQNSRQQRQLGDAGEPPPPQQQQLDGSVWQGLLDEGWESALSPSGSAPFKGLTDADLADAIAQALAHAEERARQQLQERQRQRQQQQQQALLEAAASSTGPPLTLQGHPSTQPERLPAAVMASTGQVEPHLQLQERLSLLSVDGDNTH